MGCWNSTYLKDYYRVFPIENDMHSDYGSLTRAHKITLKHYSLKINELNQSFQAGVNFFQLNSC